jgi:hypothetical protein
MTFNQFATGVYTRISALMNSHERRENFSHNEQIDIFSSLDKRSRV